MRRELREVEAIFSGYGYAILQTNTGCDKDGRVKATCCDAREGDDLWQNFITATVSDATTSDRVWVWGEVGGEGVRVWKAKDDYYWTMFPDGNGGRVAGRMIERKKKNFDSQSTNTPDREIIIELRNGTLDLRQEAARAWLWRGG